MGRRPADQDTPDLFRRHILLLKCQRVRPRRKWQIVSPLPVLIQAILAEVANRQMSPSLRRARHVRIDANGLEFLRFRYYFSGVPFVARLDQERRRHYDAQTLSRSNLPRDWPRRTLVWPTTAVLRSNERSRPFRRFGCRRWDGDDFLDG